MDIQHSHHPQATKIRGIVAGIAAMIFLVSLSACTGQTIQDTVEESATIDSLKDRYRDSNDYVISDEVITIETGESLSFSTEMAEQGASR